MLGRNVIAFRPNLSRPRPSVTQCWQFDNINNSNPRLGSSIKSYVTEQRVAAFIMLWYNSGHCLNISQTENKTFLFPQHCPAPWILTRQDPVTSPGQGVVPYARSREVFFAQQPKLFVHLSCPSRGMIYVLQPINEWITRPRLWLLCAEDYIHSSSPLMGIDPMRASWMASDVLNVGLPSANSQSQWLRMLWCWTNSAKAHWWINTYIR